MSNSRAHTVGSQFWRSLGRYISAHNDKHKHANQIGSTFRKDATSKALDLYLKPHPERIRGP